MIDLIFGHFGARSRWHIKLTITCQDRTLSSSCRQMPAASVCWPSWALRRWALYAGLWCTHSFRLYSEEQARWLRGPCVQHAEMSRSSGHASVLSHLPWVQVPSPTSSRTLPIVTFLYCTHLVVVVKCSVWHLFLYMVNSSIFTTQANS